MKKEIGSIRNIILSIIIVFIGFLALSFGIGGRIIGEFWLLIAGLLASRIIYGKMFYLFKKMKVKDGLLVIGCLGLAIIWVIIYGIISQLLGLSMESNPVMESPNFWTFVLFIPALLGEELLVLVPVSVILRRLEEKQKKTKWSVALLVLISSLLFGALHLPTYQWNFLQAVLAVGIVRVPFTLAYIKTKNILPAFLTHFLYDSLIVLISILVS